MNCYSTTDGVPDNIYARLNVHVNDSSDFDDALNTFLLSVAHDVLDRGGTHRELYPLRLPIISYLRRASPSSTDCVSDL